MPIDKIAFKFPVGTVPDNIKSQDKQSDKADAKDRVVLSDEALQLFASEQARKLDTIRERVRTGFYETREVTEKVVDGLIRDIKRPPTA